MSSVGVAGLLRVDVTKPIVLVIAGRVTSADAPRLSGELCAELSAGTAVRETGAPPYDDTAPAEVICDVSGLVQPSLAAVEVLARLQLAARRRGRRLRLRGAGRELRLLLDLVGLGGIDQRTAGEPDGDRQAP
ncbi:STAS domain-containing protein [Streptomyces sp. NPDC088400]|uniref:STAS domain-containing protein n=1 Tax=Streptomyces sp. NPDC088400 TaxID=3365861 RepID=UPI00381A9EAD